MKPQDILLGGGSWDSPPWLFTDKLSSRASKLLVWRHGSDRLASQQVLCSECTPSSVLQMGEGTGCDYYLIAAGVNLVCQHIHVLLVASPSFLLCHCQYPSGEPSQVPWQSLCCEIIIGASHKLIPMLKLLWLPPRVLFSPWRLRGSLSSWCSTGLEEWHVELLSYPSKVVCSASLCCGGCFSFTLVF